MGIQCFQPAAVVNFDVVAVAAAPTVKAIGDGNCAVCGGKNRCTFGTGNIGAGVGTDLAGDGVYAIAELRSNRARYRQRPLQCACWGAGVVRIHKFTAALRKAAEQFCPQLLILWVLEQLQVGALAGGEMVVRCHLFRCFVG